VEAGARTPAVIDPSQLLPDDPCPRCGKPQLMRQGRYGEFKTCSDYPACKPERKARTKAAPTIRIKTPKPAA
jgi:ssDNA-binding Zn-finger/Zn-ribbon topoisomerase 1